MEMGRNLEHTTERLSEGLRCPWKWGLCGQTLCGQTLGRFVRDFVFVEPGKMFN